MYLATFTVSILETDPESGKIDVSYNEVGSTEINEADVLAALNIARSQADLIVDGLKSAGFSGLTRKDCQIHLRVANLQLALDAEWVAPGQLGAGICPYFYYDPRAVTLRSLHTSSGPSGVRKHSVKSAPTGSKCLVCGAGPGDPCVPPTRDSINNYNAYLEALNNA